jgi:hypothetical protein
METSYEVFRGTPSKSPVWIGSADSLKKAVDLMNRMAGMQPADYFVFHPARNEVVAGVQQSVTQPVCSSRVPQAKAS